MAQEAAALTAVTSATSGTVNGENQGNGMCPICGKEKFRFCVGDDDYLTYFCQSGTCRDLSDDAAWLGDVRDKLVAAQVPENAFRLAGHASGRSARAAADSVPTVADLQPVANLPSHAQLDRWHDTLQSSPFRVRQVRKRFGLTREQIEEARLGFDLSDERLVVPICDPITDDLLTLIRRALRSDVDPKYKSLILTGSSGAYLYAPFDLDPDKPVLIVGGEKDVLTAYGHGLTNVCCFTNGEGSLPPTPRLRALAGATVVVCYDIDESGQKGARKVATGLLDIAGEVRIADLSVYADRLPNNGDVYDVLTHEELGSAALDDVVVNATAWGEKDARESALDEQVTKEVERLQILEAARDLVAQQRADAAFAPPPSDWSLKESLAKEREPLKYTIDRLHPTGSSTVVAAQYKVGKTTLMANLAQSYADGSKFLGNFDMEPGGGRLAIFNYELPEDMLLDLYLGPLKIENPDRIVILNLRGLNFDLRSKAAFTWAVEWLKARGCDALIMDPYGAAARLQNENDSSEARNWLLGMLDPLKHEAGIKDLWMPAHTGRAAAEEGDEHVRGASAVDDWADVRWLYTKARIPTENGEPIARRFFSAQAGRGVDVGESEIQFDKEDNSLYVSDFRGRSQARVEGASGQVQKVVTEQPGIQSSDLRNAISGGNRDKGAAIHAAVQSRLVHFVKGSRNSKQFYPGPDPTEKGVEE